MDFQGRSQRGVRRRQPDRGWLFQWPTLGLVALCFLVVSTPLRALNPDRKPDSYALQGWFTEHGLPSNKIRDIVQTRDGYLWLATGQGIARFDGARFTLFNSTTHPELNGNNFYAALEAPDGALWFGGETGLFRWRDGRFTRFTTADGLAHNYVRGLALRRDGTVVACSRKGYSFIRDGKITAPPTAWEAITGVGRAFLERGDGTFLLGTTTGLWRVTGDAVERLSGDGKLEGNSFFSLIETADGTAWVGYSGGVYCLRRDGTSEQFGREQGLTNTRVASIHGDRDGNLWIAASSSLYRLARGRLEAANYAEAFRGSPLHAIYEDHEGGLWIATISGLFRLKDTVASTIGPADGLKETLVQTVFEAPDGATWLGLWYGGVYRYDGKRAERVPALAKLNADRVYGFAADRDGALWIAAESGLHRYADGVCQSFFQWENEKPMRKLLAERPDALLPSLAHNWVAAVATDGAGGVWAASEIGLYQRIDGKFRLWTKADGLPADNFESVLCAHNGDVWAVASPLGVVRRQAGRWITYLCGRELSARTPMALYEGTAGDIWVTTRGGGLNRFHDGKWSTFTTRHGMVEDFVAGVADDNDGHLWIAYPRGVMRIPRAEFDQIEAGSRSTLQPRIFNQSDGLPRGEISPEGRPNIFRARDGRILFGTDLGVAVIDPRSVHLNPLKPPTYIERVMINGSAADLSKAIVVPAGTNDLQIYYTAISLLAPEKVKFKIRLAPLDRDWIDADGSRDVRYAKLPAGHYTFQVKACNNDGVWSDEERRIGFRVRPYFYQTGWFVGLGVISIAGASFGIVHLRARLARRRMAMLENVVNVRTSELSLKTALLEAQLDSSPEGVLVVNTRRERVLQNRQFSELWKIPRDIAEDPDTERQVQFVRSQVKNQKQFIERVRHLYAHPDETSRDEVELCDGTFLDRYSAPVRGKDGQHYGRIWTVRDVTAQKLAQQQLLEASRQAGMAEIATGVLHNIGNVLNSVNVSATLVRDQVRTSKAANLTRVGALLREKSDDLPGFLTSDPRGSMLPAYVVSLSEHLETERNETLREIDGLRKNIEHIKDIVAMQQSHAKGAGLTEKVCVTELIEDALRITGGSLARHGVQLVRDFRSTPELIVQRHKVVQILVNLLRNAKQACSESGRPDKHVSVRIVESGPFLEIAVVDNGAGIAAENLTRIFAHGFTTRTNGHGFGLHSGALAARELGGSLSVRSDGPGRGATFTLKLPLTLDSAPA